MNFKDCIDFANKVKDCAMATLEENHPRVRMMGLWFADETGFYFQAWTFKDVFKQLKLNPELEICFHGREGESPSSMMRVRGKVEFLEDINLKKKILKDILKRFRG
jgi:pyridoxamine 5'-phosphate oxidase